MKKSSVSETIDSICFMYKIIRRGSKGLAVPI